MAPGSECLKSAAACSRAARRSGSLEGMLSSLVSILALNGAMAVAMPDWPRFLGPTGDGVAPWPEASFTWPEAGPQVLWRTAIGEGFAGVAVAGDEVFLLDREGEERDVLRVFGLADGVERWRAGYDAPGRLSFKGSRTVPTVTEHHVYTTGGFGHVTCFDRASRSIVWHVDMRATLGGQAPTWGWCAHPLLTMGLVIAAPMGEDSTLVGLSAATGEVRWRSEFLGHSHSTPVEVVLRGRRQILFSSTPKADNSLDKSAPAWIVSIDPDTGKLIWRHELKLSAIPIPPPVAVDDTRFFVTGGYRSGSKLLRLNRVDGEWRIEELFDIERGSQVHAPLVVGEHIYALVNENWNDSRRRRDEGGLMCLGLDGKERWRTGDAPYLGRGGMLRVADAMIVLDGFDGTVRAVRLDPDEYSELGTYKPFPERRDDGQLWAPPALSGSVLLLRSQSELVALDLAP